MDFSFLPRAHTHTQTLFPLRCSVGTSNLMNTHRHSVCHAFIFVVLVCHARSPEAVNHTLDTCARCHPLQVPRPLFLFGQAAAAAAEEAAASAAGPSAGRGALGQQGDSFIWPASSSVPFQRVLRAQMVADKEPTVWGSWWCECKIVLTT